MVSHALLCVCTTGVLILWADYYTDCKRDVVVDRRKMMYAHKRDVNVCVGIPTVLDLDNCSSTRTHTCVGIPMVLDWCRVMRLKRT